MQLDKISYIKMEKMISVVIPLYNKENQVAKTINSVLMQTYDNYEIIVVNDGSTDASDKVVESFNDPRIRIINQENSGVSLARNRGIIEARGEYIAFLDADDEWKTEYLETQMSLIKKYKECKVFITGYEMHKNDGSVNRTIINNIKFSGSDGVLDNYFLVASTSNPPVCSINIVVHRSAIDEIGGFPVGVKSGEDLLTWARLASRNKIAYCKNALAIFNIDGYDASETPKRIPAENDFVAQELKAIAKDFKPDYIRNYISTWYKMRSSIYMRLRMRKKSIIEAYRGIIYWPLNLKLYCFIVLNMLPSKFQPF